MYITAACKTAKQSAITTILMFNLQQEVHCKKAMHSKRVYVLYTYMPLNRKVG